jgi:uncharacterized membrane protein YraQ (UPF0718 family)
MVEKAKRQADRGIPGSMEGHAEMDMAVTDGPLLKRILSQEGQTSISHYFVMDWVSIWKDIAGGLLLAGALAVWVPKDFWKVFFLASHPTLAKVWGPVVGPLVAIASFVCSVGNVPLAAVLWNGGISFGRVLAFIFADLLILPILDIYRRYYGLRVAALVFGTFYAAMALSGLAVELVFEALGIDRTARDAKVELAHVSWNYTTYLNVVFLVVAGVLVWRYFRRGGGWAMLKAMDDPMAHAHHHHHHDHGEEHERRHAHV